MRSGAGGAGTGADWANAYTALATAFGAKAAGDDFWVSEDHAETQASAMTCNCPGTATSPCRVICVDHAGTVPPVSADLRTTATVSTTGANNLTLNGGAYYYGIAFQAGSGASSASVLAQGDNSLGLWFEACKFVLNGDGGSSRISFGAASTSGYVTRLINTTMQFGPTNTNQFSTIRGRFLWENTANAIAGSTIPTTLFASGTGIGLDARFVGVDFGAVGSGKSLFDHSTKQMPSRITFIDCKLGSSVAITTGTVDGWGAPIVRLVNCDSGNTNYRSAVYMYEGSIVSESTIVKSSGATDGTTPISRKMVSSARTKFYAPLRSDWSDWIQFWDDTTGSKTVTIATVTDNVTLKDNEAWVEVEYLGTSGYPLGLFASDAAADVLNAGTNQTTDGTSTWTTTGLTTPVKQSLSTTFTTTGKGLYRVRVCLAKASTTMYFDPLIASGARQYMIGESGYLNGEAAGAGAPPIFGIGGPLFRAKGD